MGVPAINIGSRQAGRDRGRNVVDVGYDRSEIQAAIEKAAAQEHFATDSLYGDGSAGAKIAECLVDVPLTIEKRLSY